MSEAADSSKSPVSQEQSSHHWVVLKFGGTSVSSLERWTTIADVLRTRMEEGLRPVVVCSALSQVSNRLETLLADAADGRDPQDGIEQLRRLHLKLARDMGIDGEDLIGEELENLGRLVTGISLTRELTPRLHAQALSTGEILSTRLGAAWLSAQGIPTSWQSALDLLDAETDNADAAFSPERHYLSATCTFDFDESLDAKLQGVPESVILTQGFVARDSEGDTVLLGRGGSDTSAAYLAARLGAERLEIWTDVPGMFTSNPSRIRNTRLLLRVAYPEAAELASCGAKVLHPRCLAPVRERGIPLHLRSTQNPRAVGTVIADDKKNQPGIKAVVTRQDMVVIDLQVEEQWQRVGLIAQIGEIVRDHGISIDKLASSMTHVTVVLDPTANQLTESILQALLADLEAVGRPKLVRPTAAVSVVGSSIGDVLHEVGPLLKHFEHENVHLVSQAANDLSLTVLVDENASDQLVQRLHDDLFADRTESDPSLGPSWESFGRNDEETTRPMAGARPA